MNARSQTCLSLEYFSRVINSQEPIESLILTEIRLTITDVLFCLFIFFTEASPSLSFIVFNKH